jgi:4-hydroxybenzoate polyprenyltransferase
MAQDYVAASRRPDGSRRFRIGLAVIGVICCVIVTLTMEEKSLGLLFGLAFSLAWWSEIAKRLPLVVGGLGIVIILAAAGYRVGWESVIFLLVFVALWRVAGDEWLYHA